MPSTIITKNSSTASAVPGSGSLTQGELAVNVTDKKLYTKDSGGSVVTLTDSMARQASSNVTITGGSITGITDLAVADGGTGASTAATARTNLGLDGFVNMKNRIINGAMVIDQRNAGASVTVTDSAPYTLDRWWGYSSPTSKFTIQQNAGSVTPPAGFKNYLGATSSSAYTVTSADQFIIPQIIEGYNVADLEWGTANAKTVTLSFWVRSSLTGTFAGSIQNGSSLRSYVFSYSIPVANTWTQISVTIAGDTTGTWNSTNGSGLIVIFTIGAGTNYNATAGAWSAGNFKSVSGATSVVGTNGATFYITGVQLEVGSTATSFDYRPYGTELALCQRYFCKTFTITTAPVANTQNSGALMGKGNCASDIEPFCTWQTPVEMRTTPTVTLYSISNSVSANNQWTSGAAIATANARAGGIGVGTRQIQIDNTGNLSGSAGSQFYIQAAATAEL